MRWVFCLAMMLSAASPALAADLDVLRGSQPIAPVVTVGPATFTRWSGFYVGGAVSYNDVTTDFTNSTQPLIAFSLRATTLEEQVHPSGIGVLSKGAANAFGGGAFLGYNTQWQDLIIGVEATYTHTNLNTTATGSAIARIFPTVTDAVALNGSGRLNLTDYAEGRIRAGYIVGNLLPYGFIGVAVGRASFTLSRTLHNPRTPTIPIIPVSAVYRHRPVVLFPLPTAPAKTTPCYGASPSAPDWIGR